MRNPKLWLPFVFVCVEKQQKCGWLSATESELHVGSDSFQMSSVQGCLCLSVQRVGPPIGDTILIYLHGSGTVEDSTVAVITEYHFYQEPKAFDSWGHLTVKPSHILKGVMQ